LPYCVTVGGARLLIVPYSGTLNDSRDRISPEYAAPEHFVRNVRAALHYLLEEASHLGGRMMTIAVHARWAGNRTGLRC
jgi:hypothetical protein